ncbi:DUF6276 family protein [Halovivax limisalsi]|uniref:DUF6276 family protein n=1 Tax=Halovivax limisalsi TaxID=1453760 RepID=UPI001FFD7CF4|nr:DUF6276 family protein [Halovivax limisalsi]
MSCSCDADPVIFTVRESRRSLAPESAGAAAICPTCLTVEPVASPPPKVPDFSRVSDSFPPGEGGVAMALVLSLVDSLAHNRRELESALEAAERAGVDPLLVIDRLVADPGVEPAVDLERRRDKLESLLY